MGRPAILTKRKAILTRIPIALNHRLAAYSQRFGLSKNDIVE